MIKKFLLIIILLLCILMAGCMQSEKKNQLEDELKQENKTEQTTKDTNVKSEPIVHQNTEYGFEFSLPASWKGYKIVESKWEGMVNDGSGKIIETGPIISIRHPLWTSQNPRQDIPIMIFTTSQWESLQQDQFHIGAAPIGPSELGRNFKYVFALPARYNFSFPTGYEEVETILSNKPLKPTENFESDLPDSSTDSLGKVFNDFFGK